MEKRFTVVDAREYMDWLRENFGLGTQAKPGPKGWGKPAEDALRRLEGR